MRPDARWILALAAAALAGCGEPGPEDAVDTATAWFEAVRDEKPAEACEAMTSTAAGVIRRKYLRGVQATSCPDVVRAYRERLSDRLLGAIDKSGLEFNGEPRNGRLGVFPAAKQYELNIILMQLVDDEWKVASVGIAPDRAPPGQ